MTVLGQKTRGGGKRPPPRLSPPQPV